jgi:hypothetical protein
VNPKLQRWVKQWPDWRNILLEAENLHLAAGRDPTMLPSPRPQNRNKMACAFQKMNWHLAHTGSIYEARQHFYCTCPLRAVLIAHNMSHESVCIPL